MNRQALSLFVAFLGLIALLVASFAADWRAGIAVSGAVLIGLGWMIDAPAPGDEP